MQKWLNEQAVLFEREVRHDPQPVNHAMTLAAYTEHWLRDIAPGKLAASTYSRDQQDIRRILPALGHYKLTDLRKETIRAFYEAMRSEPKLTDGQPLSERSVEGLHNTLCSILSGAVEEGYLTHNPAWRVYKPKGVRKERPVADEETVQKLIAALETQSMKYEV
ncbi:site-specific integrase, partial [Gemmiger formicilis]|uniref:site-specific integrase n=1 Tax=Gemmiger formicilis TaxID=745368 RepID=UPI003D3206D4